MPGIEHVPIQWAKPAWIVARQGQMAPVVIVDHIMQGYLRTMVDWARTGGSKVIVHFGVGRDGRTVQFQDVRTPGIHASSLNRPVARRAIERNTITGGANTYSIGIEHEGCSIDPRPAYTVPPELIYSPSNPWPAAMTNASLAIKRWCFANVPTLGAPDRDSIIGHCEVDAANRGNDPATPADRVKGIWPVDRFIQELTGNAAAPEKVVHSTAALVTHADNETSDTEPTPMATTYKVKRGDTLGAIAVEFRVSIAQLIEWNSIENANEIHVDQVLRVTPPGQDEEAPPDGSFDEGWTAGWRAGYTAAVQALDTRLRLIEQQADAARLEAEELAAAPPAPPPAP